MYTIHEDLQYIQITILPHCMTEPTIYVQIGVVYTKKYQTILYKQQKSSIKCPILSQVKQRKFFNFDLFVAVTKYEYTKILL